MKNPSYSIGNRTRDLPFCSAVQLYSKTMPFTIICVFRRKRKKFMKLTINYGTRKKWDKGKIRNKTDLFLFLYKAWLWSFGPKHVARYERTVVYNEITAVLEDSVVSVNTVSQWILHTNECTSIYDMFGVCVCVWSLSQLRLTLNIPRGVLWRPQRVIFLWSCRNYIN